MKLDGVPAFDLSPKPPAVERRPVFQSAHGVELGDPYAWLRADNWQDVLRDPAALPADIAAVLAAQNDYADAVLAPLQALQGVLRGEMRARIKEDDASVPVADGPFEYYTRHRENGQHEIVCRRAREDGPEQILLDGDALAQGRLFFEIGAAQASPDHRLLAWSFDDRGSELYTIQVRTVDDSAASADLADSVPQTDGQPVWSADGRGFFYTRVDANHRPCSVLYHQLGTAPDRDRLVLDEPDPGLFVSIHASRSRRYGLIVIHDHDSSETHVVDLAVPEGDARLIEPRQPGVRYQVDHARDRFFILTNVDGAKDFKIVSAPVDSPGRAGWQDLVPHHPGRMIISVNAYKDHLVRLEREDGLPRIVVRSFADEHEQAIAFDEEAYSLSLSGLAEFDSPVCRFTYSSLTTPDQTFDFDMNSGQRRLRKAREIPSGHDLADYVIRRIVATAADGAKIPVSLVHHRSTPRDGTAPVLLYAYGAYGHATPAGFGSNRLSLVDRGFVFAIAHVRGGTDKGWDWYEDGKFEKKTNTFDDFIAAARTLIAEGYTSAGRIVGQGGSAGGMLIGAVANRAPPDLFGGLIADVPFVDVLNTMLDATLPLTPPEWLEWGNPITDQAVFEAMRCYSPYDNVSARRYPAILALGGLTDPRVTYWEPAKWVARLQATMTGGGPALLKTNMKAGHGGASGRFDRLEEVALEYAFALACVSPAAAAS